MFLKSFLVLILFDLIFCFNCQHKSTFSVFTCSKSNIDKHIWKDDNDEQGQRSKLNTRLQIVNFNKDGDDAIIIVSDQ